MLSIEIIPFKSFKEKIRLVKRYINMHPTVESNYIWFVSNIR